MFAFEFPPPGGDRVARWVTPGRGEGETSRDRLPRTKWSFLELTTPPIVVHPRRFHRFYPRRAESVESARSTGLFERESSNLQVRSLHLIVRLWKFSYGTFQRSSPFSCEFEKFHFPIIRYDLAKCGIFGKVLDISKKANSDIRWSSRFILYTVSVNL